MQYWYRYLWIILTCVTSTTQLTAKEPSVPYHIDTLVIYSPAVEAYYEGDQESRIYHLIQETNQHYQENNLPIQIDPVKVLAYPISDTLSSKETIQVLQKDPKLQALRDEYGADEVLIYRLYHPQEQSCGIAYINRYYQSDYAFALVAINCSAYQSAHELGHTMGLYHSEKTDPTIGYARGYGIEGSFSTIMAYSKNYQGTKVYSFSNPNRECQGLPCGVPIGELHEANAYQALLDAAPIIATYKPHQKQPHETNSTLTARLAQAKADYLQAKATLDDLESAYQAIQEQYQKRLEELQKSIQSYNQHKATYLKLTNPLKAQEYYQRYLKPVINTYKESTFMELYQLETQRNKFKLSYDSYKESVYLPAKATYEELLQSIEAGDGYD